MTITQKQFEDASISTKVFVAHITIRHGNYEIEKTCLVLTDTLANAEQYVREQGLPYYNSEDVPAEQYEGHGVDIWYFDCGDWAIKLNYVEELADQAKAKIIAESGLISFL